MLALSEERDKEKRKLNFIVYNAVKPTAEDGQARKKQDVSFQKKSWSNCLSNCDRILENLPFGNISWSNIYNHPYLLGKRSFWGGTSQQDSLIVALSKYEKKIILKKMQRFSSEFSQ